MTSHDCRHAPEESPPSPAKPAHNSIYLAAASIDITPQNPLPLAGYRRRPDRFSRVRDPLEVNGVLLRQGDRVAVILSADLLYVTDHLKDLVLGRLSREFSGAPFSVIFGASHTHSAPAVDDTKPVLGTANRNYVEFVAVQVMKLIDALAAKQAKAATIAYQPPA